MPLWPYWRKRQGGLEDGADVVELGRLDAHADGLAVLAGQARLGVEGIDLAGAAVHVEEDDALGPGGEMRPAGRVRVGGGLGLRAGAVVEEGGEGDGAEAVGAAQEHGAAGEEREVAAAVHGGVRN